MKSEKRGKATLVVEVTQIDEQGIWLLLHDTEMFLPFEKFPWFRNASVGAIQNVELLNEDHLHWPDLDVDLHVESIEFPERFPLVSK